MVVDVNVERRETCRVWIDTGGVRAAAPKESSPVLNATSREPNQSHTARTAYRSSPTRKTLRAPSSSSFTAWRSPPAKKNLHNVTRRAKDCKCGGRETQMMTASAFTSAGRSRKKGILIKIWEKEFAKIYL